MKLTVCIGSSCHIKGSQNVVEQLQKLIEKHGLEDKVDLCGSFCMGKCRQGVCVAVDDEVFSVRPENTEQFFENEILTKI